mmetsp:Transcript_128783/g.372617  ORF Transcript_128783/g.372617 Transcript_128783/m.372617 type:complete len:204 (+) Transcript_128783:1140-1751(+)
MIPPEEHAQNALLYIVELPDGRSQGLRQHVVNIWLPRKLFQLFNPLGSQLGVGNVSLHASNRAKMNDIEIGFVDGLQFRNLGIHSDWLCSKDSAYLYLVTRLASVHEIVVTKCDHGCRRLTWRHLIRRFLKSHQLLIGIERPIMHQLKCILCITRYTSCRLFNSPALDGCLMIIPANNTSEMSHFQVGNNRRGSHDHPPQAYK